MISMYHTDQPNTVIVLDDSEFYPNFAIIYDEDNNLEFKRLSDMNIRPNPTEEVDWDGDDTLFHYIFGSKNQYAITTTTDTNLVFEAIVSLMITPENGEFYWFGFDDKNPFQHNFTFAAPVQDKYIKLFTSILRTFSHYKE